MDERDDDRPDGARDEGELDRALSGWMAAEPPDGFAARVLAKAGDEGIVAPPAAVAAERRAEPARTAAAPASARRWRMAALGLGLAAAAALVLALYPRGGAEGLPGPASGAVHATARETVPLGGRGVAVAEAGTDLSWAVDGEGAASLAQSAGDVFYRVERGEPFVVSTPAGDVRVRGTCFRVEVEEMGIERQGVAGAMVGAVAAAAIVVTVYEGRVVLANDQGQSVIEAGERAWASAGSAPGEPVDMALTPAERAQLAAEPGSDATPEELQARNAALRAAQREAESRMDGLRARVSELEQQLARADGEEPRRINAEQWFPASQEQLLALAEACSLRLDQPPLLGPTPMEQVGDRDAEKMGLAQEERAMVLEAVQRLHRSYLERLRPLYVEATGDTEGVESLSPRAMLGQIQETAPPDERGLMARIARERAGLVQAPGDPSALSASERAVRLFAGLGDELQEILAQSLGPDRAYQLRAAAGGWPWSRSEFNGCNR